MKIGRGFFALALVLAFAGSVCGYTLSGDISGAQLFGGITYIYALPLDTANFNFYIGFALLGNGAYSILNVPEGNYVLLAFQDRDGSFLPSEGDYIGFYGEGFPELVEVMESVSGLDIEVEPLPSTTITGLISCPAGYSGPTYILAATDPDFEEIAHLGFLLTLDGNGDYTLFVEPGEYYVMAFLDADFDFNLSIDDPQAYWGAPGPPELINVTGSPAENIDLPMQVPPTGIEDFEDETVKPKQFELHGAYPNPFNPTATIRFDLPVASEVRLIVFDIRGSRVGVASPFGDLAPTRQYSPGSHQITFDGSNQASGIYLYCLTAGEFIATGKMVLLK